MGTRTMAVTLLAVAAGAIPGHGAAGAPQEATLFHKPKPAYLELFTAQPPAPKTGVKPAQPFRVESHPVVEGERIRMRVPAASRVVCGMRVFEADADVDPGIVMPISEGHHARIRVLGPAPCERAAPASSDRK